MVCILNVLFKQTEYTERAPYMYVGCIWVIIGATWCQTFFIVSRSSFRRLQMKSALDNVCFIMCNVEV